MDTTTYSELDCVGIVNAIAHRDMTVLECRDLATSALQGISSWNAVAEIYVDRTTNESRGALAGVPLLHKDGGAQIAGYPRYYGSALGAGSVGTVTSHFFHTLQSHGCQVVGRSQVPELHMSVLGDNEILGSTRNPWNVDRSMGGSTAGVTAVALGAVPAAHGGDSGGSLRVPASWAGCYTLKPTSGSISASPGGTELFGLNEIFVVTRSLRDLRLFLGVLSGPATDDFRVARAQLPHWASKHPKVAVIDRFYEGHDVDPYILETLHDFARDAEHIGFNVIQARLQLDFDAICHALYVIGSIDLKIMVNSLSDGNAETVSRKCQPYVAQWYADSLQLTSEDVFLAFETIGAVARQFARTASAYDFVATPVTAEMPPSLDSVHSLGVTEGSRALSDRFEEMVHFCAAVSMSGYPALVMPYARPGRPFPCGVQVVGRPGDDLGLLELGEIFTRGFVKPPNHMSLS